MNRIRSLRYAARMSQEQVAAAANGAVSRETISRLEQDGTTRRPSVDVANALADVFGVDVVEVLGSGDDQAVIKKVSDRFAPKEATA